MDDMAGLERRAQYQTLEPAQSRQAHAPIKPACRSSEPLRARPSMPGHRPAGLDYAPTMWFASEARLDG
jgi:hypothetical protein